MFILVEWEGIIHPHGQEHFSGSRTGEILQFGLSIRLFRLDMTSLLLWPGKTLSSTSSPSRRVKSLIIRVRNVMCLYRKIINYMVVWYSLTQNKSYLIRFPITACSVMFYSVRKFAKKTLHPNQASSHYRLHYSSYKNIVLSQSSHFFSL